MTVGPGQLNTDEPVLVRCRKGLLCDTPCLMGRELDEYGCETCQCREPVNDGKYHNIRYIRESLECYSDILTIMLL